MISKATQKARAFLLSLEKQEVYDAESELELNVKTIYKGRNVIGLDEQEIVSLIHETVYNAIDDATDEEAEENDNI